MPTSNVVSGYQPTDQILGDVLLSRITVVKFLTQSGNNRLYDLDILPLIMAADVICLEESSLLLHKVNTLAVIFDIQPVTDVLSVAVYREGLAMKGIVDHHTCP